MTKFNKIRPGKGWIHRYGAVYEHDCGTRIHMMGLVRLRNGELIHMNDCDYYQELHLMIQINGGNRLRGLMAWAMNHESKVSA